MEKKHELIKNEQPILKIGNISLLFGELTALSGVSLEVKEGEIFGLIGPNGSGKTCILIVLTAFTALPKATSISKGKELPIFRGIMLPNWVLAVHFKKSRSTQD